MTEAEELELLELEKEKAHLRVPGQQFRGDTTSIGPIGAAAVHGADSLTLGFADELAGAVQNPSGALKSFLGKGKKDPTLSSVVTGKQEIDPDVADYESDRDTFREIQARAAKEHPYASAAGTIGGAILGPGKLLAPLKGARAVVGAAGLGAIAGAGMSTADLADREYGRLAFDTALGGIVGAGSQALVNKVGGAISNRFGKAAASAVDDAVPPVPPIPPPGGPSGPVVEKATQRAGRWAKEIFKSTPVDNADEVAGAVKAVSGQETVPGFMLAKDKPTQQLAGTLLKSPTIGGALTRREVQPVYDGLERFGKAVAERAGGLSAHETGTAVKRGAAERFRAMIAPAEKIYDGLEAKFSSVPLERTAFKRGISKLRAQFSTDFTGASQKLIDQLENTFAEVKDVQSLRQFRTNLGQYLEGNVSSAQKRIIGTMYGVLTRERDRSIVRSAVTTGAKISRQAKGAGLVKDLKSADRTYGQAVRSAAEALGVEGSNKTATSTAIRQYLQDTPAEQVVKDLFNKGDFSAIQRLQEVFPDQYKMVKDLAVRQLVEASSENGQLSVQRLSTNLHKYSPEVRQLLLGDLGPQLKNVQTTLGALPRNFNPSDTSSRLEFLDLLSPTKNVQSLVQRQVLTGRAPSAGAVAQTMGKGPQQNSTVIIQKLQAAGPGAEKYLKALGDALQRGPQAFAATYYLLNSSQPAFRAILGRDEGSR